MFAAKVPTAGSRSLPLPLNGRVLAKAEAHDPSNPESSADPVNQQLRDLEIRIHGSLEQSPFYQRYGRQFGLSQVGSNSDGGGSGNAATSSPSPLRNLGGRNSVVEPRTVMQLYAQSFCNIGQLNISHEGDNARRLITAGGIALVPYSAE